MITCQFRAFICAEYFEMDELKVSINETWCIASKCNWGFVGSSLILTSFTEQGCSLSIVHALFRSFVIQVVNVILTCAINVQKFKHKSLKVQICYETGQPECIKHPPTKSKNCWWAFANMATVVMDDSDQGKLEIELWRFLSFLISIMNW